MRWIKDEDFIRGNIPMTKFEVRIITLGLLEVEKDDIFLDIGAGTGSISIEAALQGAEVHAIEKEPEGVELIKGNAKKFGANINIIEGTAPGGIDEVTVFNKCFIGGSGGKLEPILKAVDKKISQGGIVAANFVTLNNMYEFKNFLETNNYKDIDIRLIQSSRVEGTGIMKAQNPVFIIRGKKA